eukprot:SAG31_NODE_13788_length_847_cov_0.890374_2_plen_33_part_00
MQMQSGVRNVLKMVIQNEEWEEVKDAMESGNG